MVPLEMEEQVAGWVAMGEKDAEEQVWLAPRKRESEVEGWVAPSIGGGRGGGLSGAEEEGVRG